MTKSVAGTLFELLANHPEMELSRAARALALSGRTLQRRLAKAGTSFQLTRDRVRRNMALTSMARKTTGVRALGVRLGFADESAFCRAFRRWTGETPTKWRSLQLAKEAA